MVKKYRINYVSDYVYDGYMTWWPTVVKVMQTSKVLNYIMKPMWVGWANEMAHRANPRIKGSLIGRIVLDTLTPVSRFLGRRRRIRCQTYLKA